MTDVRGFVQQQSRSIPSDGNWASAYVNRSGGFEVNSIQGQYDSWLRRGIVFEGHFATEGGTATIENNIAVDLTEPFLTMGIPASKAVVIIQVKVAAAVVWESGDEVVMYASDTNVSATAGGAAGDVRSLFIPGSGTGQPASSAVTFYDGDAALTDGTITNPRILDVHHFLTGGLHLPYEYNVLKGDPWFYIQGAASWGLMIARTTTTVEVLYTVKWAELDKNELVNS